MDFTIKHSLAILDEGSLIQPQLQFTLWKELSPSVTQDKMPPLSQNYGSDSELLGLLRSIGRLKRLSGICGKTM